MNVPKLSDAELRRLADRENNASVLAGNPQRFSRKTKNSSSSAGGSRIGTRGKKELASIDFGKSDSRQKVG
jgi:hypothetical protein